MCCIYLRRLLSKMKRSNNASTVTRLKIGILQAAAAARCVSANISNIWDGNASVGDVFIRRINPATSPPDVCFSLPALTG